MSDVPAQLGKYQIRRAIGKGAMGIVYEGFDPVIDRVVAIKTIRKDELDPAEAEEHSRRFLIEAKAAGRLNHRNIVGIYDYGEEKGLSFIVMEFVQGRELKSFFAARHPFSLSQVARLMDQLLDALGYSHGRGVIHRDVKPDNIFITDDGAVKLGDFGIARIDATSKTHAGTVLGTPSYMAPEQIRGETADARADLYAAGVILYQFLVGERPFSGGMVAVMQKVLMEAPRPPSSHNPAIPPAIDAVVLRALAKSADDRFASAADFSRALTAAVGLADAGDAAESTMILSAEAMRGLQEAATGTGTGTGGAGRSGTSASAASGSRSAAVEEARRRAEETRRRYEEDLRRAQLELHQAEEEQRAAEAQAQGQAQQEALARAEPGLASASALLDEAAAGLRAGQALLEGPGLLVDAPVVAAAARARAARLREAGAAIGESLPAAPPALQADLQARHDETAAAASAQEALAQRLEHEGGAALAGLTHKLALLENRLAAQDGAWGPESRALQTLDAAAGDAPLAAIAARLDAFAFGVDEVGKGFAALQAQRLALPAPQAERLAVIEAQWRAQSASVARLRIEADAARGRVRAAMQARQVGEAQAWRPAEGEADGHGKEQAEAEAQARRRSSPQRVQAATQPPPPVALDSPSPSPAPSPTRQPPAPVPGGDQRRLLPMAAVAAVLAAAAGAWWAVSPTSGTPSAPAAAHADLPAGPATAMRAPPASPSPARSPPADVSESASPRPADDVARPSARPDATTKSPAETTNATPRPDAQPAMTQSPSTTPETSSAEAVELFRQGDSAYLSGRVAEGVRQMERADAMGAPGARARLCAIYRKPTAAEGKDFLKEATKCKDVD